MRRRWGAGYDFVGVYLGQLHPLFVGGTSGGLAFISVFVIVMKFEMNVSVAHGKLLESN